MNQIQIPWIEAAVLCPIIGAAWVNRLRNAENARLYTLIFAGLTLICAIGAWANVYLAPSSLTGDGTGFAARLIGADWFVLDQLSAPLFPLAALLYFLTPLTTLRTKMRRFSFSGMLFSEAVLLALVSCKQPWGIVVLLTAETVYPWLELRARGKPDRVYRLHMTSLVALLVAGCALVELGDGRFSGIAVVLLLPAIMLRCGIAPLHCWVPDLIEQATFGTALLFVTPMTGAYAAVRLLLPIAPNWALQLLVLMSLSTAVYAAGMALIQHEARRFFAYLFLSYSALVLVGLSVANAVSLTGALSIWLSVGLALSGLGLTLRSVEARIGRLQLDKFHGLYEHMPMLAALFLLSGLASVGFPGTFGFIGTELLVDGTVQAYPYIGMAVVIAAALNGIAVLQAYLKLFTGTRHVTSISLRKRRSEQIAILGLTVLIFGGGLFPRFGIDSRNQAATQICQKRAALHGAHDEHPPDS